MGVLALLLLAVIKYLTGRILDSLGSIVRYAGKAQWQWPQSPQPERELLLLSLLPPFYSYPSPTAVGWMVPLTFRVSPAFSLKHTYKHTHKCVSLVILNPVKLVMKDDYQHEGGHLGF